MQPVIRFVINVKNALVSLLFPPLCEACGALLPLGSSKPVCRRCLSQIKWLKPPYCRTCGRTVGPDQNRCLHCEEEGFCFDRAYACAIYEGVIKELLHRYKFKRKKRLSLFFTESMARFLQTNLDASTFDSVAAMPLDNEKRRSRGFNQSALLAAGLSRALRLRDLSARLARLPSKLPQSLLSKKDRKSNVRGCFIVEAPDAAPLGRVLLVDDILTSGQTASECARALKAAGASAVTVIACAKGL